MNTIEAINKALPIFLANQYLEDEDLVDVFIKEGFTPSLARKVVIFMPMAFGRIIMNELRVTTSDEYECFQKKGIFTDKRRGKLNDIEIYRESFKIASQMSRKGAKDETFLAIALRSCEVNAVKDMEQKGVNPQRAVLTPFATMWEMDEETQPNNTESTQTNNTKSEQANSTESVQAKNWWEFWK